MNSSVPVTCVNCDSSVKSNSTKHLALSVPIEKTNLQHCVTSYLTYLASRTWIPCDRCDIDFDIPPVVIPTGLKEKDVRVVYLHTVKRILKCVPTYFCLQLERYTPNYQIKLS
jgi:hypothetical protein